MTPPNSTAAKVLTSILDAFTNYYQNTEMEESDAQFIGSTSRVYWSKIKSFHVCAYSRLPKTSSSFPVFRILLRSPGEVSLNVYQVLISFYSPVIIYKIPYNVIQGPMMIVH